MDYMLVFHLMFGIISSGHIHKVMPDLITDSQKCYAKCPAGYYQRGRCNGHTGNYSCEKCSEGTFTAIANTLESCLRCTPCTSLQDEKEKCAFDRDRKCDCMKGTYKENSQCKACDHFDDSQRWDIFQKMCLNNPDCRRKCEAFLIRPTTTATTKVTVASPTKSHREKDSLMMWVLAVVAAVLILIVWLLLLFTKNVLSKDSGCLSWTAHKNLSAEDPKCTAQRSHQGSGPTTLTIKVSEETPMMSLRRNPATQPHSTLTSRLLPGTDLTASKLEDPSDRWPAIVLYTIIKAVPLRRWKEFLRLLSVADHEMERVELEAGLGQGFMEKQYQMLRLWSQRSSAGMGEVFSTLRYMDLSGCAQLLQESLEKLPWRSELKQDLLTCKSPADCGSNGTMQDALIFTLDNCNNGINDS